MHISKKNIWQMLLIVLASLVCGVTRNFTLQNPLSLFRAPSQSVAQSGAVVFGEVDADFVGQLGGDPGTVLVDARFPELFAQGHIPGAISLPLSRFADALATRLEQLQAARLLVLYCSGPDCRDSHDLALKLREKGFQELLLYRGGMEDWLEKGNALAR